MSAPIVEVERIPVTCTVTDVCRVLKMSRSEFYEKREWLRSLGVLVPIVPQLGRRPKYQGAALARFLGADGQAAQVRRVLRAVT